jgi:homoserine dehydrogenase
VLAAIANEFGQHDVSISSMEQEDLESSARLLFITHEAVESNFRATLAGLEQLTAVKSVGRVLRVIGS